MALSTLEQNTILRGISAAKKAVEELRPILDELNIIYDSAGGVKTTITQQNMDAAAFLSNMTKGQLDDGFYALTATLRGDIVNAYSQLAILAARG